MVRALKHDQGFIATLEISPLRVGASHVGEKHSVRPTGCVQHERQVAGLQPERAAGYQSAEPGAPDELMARVGVAVLEVSGYVHWLTQGGDLAADERG